MLDSKKIINPFLCSDNGEIDETVGNFPQLNLLKTDLKIRPKNQNSFQKTTQLKRKLLCTASRPHCSFMKIILLFTLK